MLIPQNQRFYSGSVAMKLELSANGIFLMLAKAKGKNKEGNMTYNWENQRNAKMNVSEISYLLEAMRVHRKEGEEAYKKLGSWLSGNAKYPNVQFVHRSDNGESRVGLSSYNNVLSFQIVVGKDSVSYPVQKMDYLRIEMFLNHIIENAFHYEANLAMSKRLAKKREQESFDDSQFSDEGWARSYAEIDRSIENRKEELSKRV